MGLLLTFGPDRGRSRLRPLNLVLHFYVDSQRWDVTGDQRHRGSGALGAVFARDAPLKASSVE
jgi:hypothetical protein